MNEKVYGSSIDLDSGIGAKYAILPGDPERVAVIAGYLENPKPLSVHREYTSYEGYLDGEKILVISTGMGGPSAAIAVEELAMIGVDTVIRLGTCGGMQPEVRSGELILPTAAIRQEGTTKEYVYGEFPAAANFDVVRALDEAAEKVGVKVHKGIVQSKDSYYGQHMPDRMPAERDLKEHYDAWIRAGALASEMECAAVFIVSQVRRLRAGAVLHVIWNKERERAGLSSKTTRDLDLAIQTVTEGIRILIKKRKRSESTNEIQF